METTVLTKSNNVPLSSSSSMDGSINTLLLPFQCSFCDETFRGHVRLVHHIAWDHQNANIEIACGLCSLVFTKPYNHIKHLFTKHLKGASVDLFEKLKTDLGCDEKWSKQRVYPKRYNQKSKPKVPSKESDTEKPRRKVPQKESDTKKRKPKTPPQTKDTQQPERTGPPKNDVSFDCSCGQTLKSQEHLEAHKSSHNIRIDPTIKCHLCAGAFDSVDEWLLHTCQRDLSPNLEQDFHVDTVQVSSRSPSRECANFSVASPACPQDFDSPAASPAGSPPQNCDSPVGSPASPPSPECDLSTPAPSSPPRARDDFTALLRTFQKVIDDLPPPTRQPLDRVPPTESSPLDEPVYDDDMECGSPAEPPSNSPQNSEGQNGGHETEVPPELTAKTGAESQGVSDRVGQLQESRQEILQVELATPPALVQQQDRQPPKTSNKVQKSKRGSKNLTAKQRKLQMPPPESPQDLEIFNLLCEFNLQPSYKCDQCAARYKFKLHLVEHKHKYCKGTRKKSTEYHGCGMCGQEFNSKEELDAHWTNSHGDSRPKSWVCDLCDNTYDWEAALKFHNDTTHRKIRETSIRICRLCSKSFKTVHHIVKHYKAEHPKNYTICPKCGQQFKDRYEKTEHEKRKHVVERHRVVCEVCGQEMIKSSLRNHIARRHAEKNFLCTNCGQSFGSLELLQLHEVTHLPKEDKPWRCKFCSYRAAQIQGLEHHMAWHHLDHDGFVEYDVEGKPKPFICDQCGKAYTSEVALEEHKIFHGERRYKCKKCGEFMFTRYHLVAHRLEVHLAEKNNFPERRPCPNPNCSKTFKTLKSLNVHQKTCGLDATAGSTGTAYTCDECGKICPFKADLTYHVRSAHSKTFAYHCEVCGKGSNSKSNLNAHMKIHGGGYECEVCKRKFLTFPILSQHSMDEHGKVATRRYRKPQGVLRSIVDSLKESSEMTQ